MLGYSILSVHRYWQSALERDSSDPDERFLGYRMSGSNSPETTLLRSRQTVEVRSSRCLMSRIIGRLREIRAGVFGRGAAQALVTVVA